MEPASSHWEAIDTYGEKFSPRTGHTIIVVKDKLYLFGGIGDSARYNDLYSLDLNSNRWTLIATSGDIPPARSGSRGFNVLNKLIFFGGYTKKNGDYFDDIREFDIQTSIWKWIHPKQETPVGRTDHSFLKVGDRAYLFGGTNGAKRFFDTWCYSIDSQSWKEIIPKNPSSHPSARFGHSCVEFDKMMYLFGGWDGANTLNDLWKFDTEKFEWTQLFAKTIAASRYRHTAVTYKNCMYLFGGVDVAQERFADLVEFNFITNEMKVIVCGGNAPSARTFHRAEQAGEYMYILGGFDGEKKNDVYRINLETNQSQSQNGVSLRSRAGPDQQVKESRISLEESYKEFMGLIEGYKHSQCNGMIDTTKHGVVSDPNFLKTLPANRWFAILPHNNYTSRTGHTATILGKEIYMFGGFEANGIKSNDILVYQIDSNTWKTIPAIGTALTPRSGSKSIGYMDQETKILVFFGGYSTGKTHNSENEYYNDLFVFDCLHSKWLQLNTGKEQVPEGRTDHCLVEHQNFLYIFAGKGKSKSLLGDFWRFNLENKKWLQIQAEGAQLRPRFGHSAVVYGDSMYVFGGWDGSVCLDELYQYSFPTNIWYDLRRSPGEKPTPRYRHDSLIINGIMYVFGGVDVSQTRYNDLYQFNIASRTWSKIVTNGCVPTPRSFHRIVSFHSCIFLLGGLDGERKNDLYLISLNTYVRPLSRPSSAKIKALPNQEEGEKPLASAIYGSLQEQAEKEQPVSNNQMIIDALNRQVIELSQMLRKEEERNLCKICFSREIDAVFLECCHFVSCYDCAKNLDHCAICRSKVESVVRTYSS